jgi:hypothetical protein
LPSPTSPCRAPRSRARSCQAPPSAL